MTKYFEASFDIPCGVIQSKVWGKVNGKPVLGLHGWLDNANTFDKLAPMLPEDVHFVAIDLPGHGKSSHKPKGVNTYDWVIDIKRVVNQLGWKKFSFLCHSMGSEYSLLYAGIFPHDVEKIILLDGFVGGLDMCVDAVDVFAAHAKAMLEVASRKNYPDMTDLTTKVFKAFQERFNESSEETAKNLLSRGVKQVAGGYELAHDTNLRVPLSTQYGMYSNSLKFRAEDYMSFFRRITSDILMIFMSEFFVKNILNHSKQGEKVKLKSGMVFNVLKQNAKVTVRLLPGNHYSHLNNPKIIMPYLNSFLSYSLLPTTSSKL